MFDYINNIFSIKAKALYEDFALLSYSTYENYRRAKKIRFSQKAFGRKEAWVEYDSLDPWMHDAIKAKLMVKLGLKQLTEPREIYKRNILKPLLMPDGIAVRTFDEYRYGNNQRLPADVQLQYTANAQVFNAMRVHITSVQKNKKLRGGNAQKGDMFETLNQSVKGIDKEKYPHSLDYDNARSLRRAYEKYIKGSYNVLIHPNFGNKNSAKINDDIKSSVLLELMSDPRNLDNTQIERLYNEFAQKLNWKPVSVATIAGWRKTMDLESTPGRRGAGVHNNTMAMQVKRKAPTYPLYYVTLDGWDVELLYQNKEMTKTGGTITTYHNRLTVVIVLDPCVKYPVGYAIGTHETPELIRSALRNAVNHVSELFGSRFMPHQLQSDRYSIKKLRPFYEAISGKAIPAAAHNAKAKVIEPYFRMLNDTYCKLFPNWSGHNVTAKSDNQPNSDFLSKFRHNFPDREGCAAQIERIVELERNKKVDRYKELWAAAPEQHKLPLNIENYLYKFGNDSEKNRLQPHGITPTIEGVEQHYDCFDPKFRQHAYVRWTVKYDPADLSKALAVNDDGTLRFMLTQKYVQPMALVERTDGDAKALHDVFNYNKQLKDAISEKRAIAGTTVKELFEHHPQLNDTLAKHILVNSLGSYKNQRNAEKINAAQTQPQQIVATEPDEDYEYIFDPNEFRRNNY